MLPFGLTLIVYGKGFVSLTVMGGMWSFSLVTIVTIFIAVFNNVVSIALRTFALSTLSQPSPSSFTGEMGTVFCPRRCEGDVECPYLPTNSIIPFRKPRHALSSLLLKELYYYLSSLPSFTSVPTLWS